MKRYLLAASITASLVGPTPHAQAQRTSPPDSPSDNPLTSRPFVLGLMAGGGTAIADHVSLGYARASATLNFTNVGVRLGKVITAPHGKGLLQNQFEIASEFTPIWQAVYPTQQLVFHLTEGTATDPDFGYTTRGVSLTPVQLRLDFVRHSTLVPWVQIACGVLWTTRDFPTTQTASVNFTPQAGIGAHLFLRRHQSVDFALNAVHLSNGDTADNNPGVTITVQASLGYSWWFHRTK